MSELYSNDFDNFRDKMDDDCHHEHHKHMEEFPDMMCPMMHPHQNLINIIQYCEITCEHMTTMLKQRDDVRKRIRQLKLLRDCADICTLTAKFLGRMSYFSKVIAKSCALICKTCGDECAKFPDPESQHCAHVCHHCARECSAFAMSRI
ncbi:four-helix bundle copper-binding protein [Clostridium sporogenes]|uniref:four-helix bundle copper-binding protein n=1 Tax=Clostridium sporogenes TaxID=1509 RepID=UPI001969C72A|nr:four-helix bundle copper-binding protein [Clostridium sporogenes]EJE7234544.1 four-helix bundle copper-binding protein [Clostridium botulinum]